MRLLKAGPTRRVASRPRTHTITLVRHDSIYGRSGRGRPGRPGRAAVARAGVPLTNLNLVSARALLPPSHSGTGNPVPHSASIPPTPVHHTRCDLSSYHHTLVACAHSRTPTSPHPPTTPPSARILVACAHSRTRTSPHHHDCLDALTRVPGPPIGVTRLDSPASPRLVPVDAVACRAYRDPGGTNAPKS